MNLSSLTLEGLTVYASSTRIELPSSGVVLVTGVNGSGKSTLVEGVAWAVWGETLRGEPPMHPDAKRALARVETRAGLMAERTKTKAGSKKLSWTLNGQGKAWETPTKAQSALEELVGPFETWRKTSVLSSHDASHFTRAADAERKRLLEGIFGLERFDAAQEARARETGTNDALVRFRASAVADLENKLASEQRRRDEAQGTLKSGAPAPQGAKDAEKQATDLRTRIRELDVERAIAHNKLRNADSAGGAHAAEAKHLRQVLDKLRGAQCPTCEQPIPNAHRKKLEQAAQAADAARRREQAEALAGTEELEKALQELDTARSELAQKLNAVERLQAVARAETARVSRLETILADALCTIAQVRKDLATARDELAKYQHEQRVLEACEKVLGLKGVRAHVLSSTLAGMEAVSNAWLERLSSQKLFLKLTPYTENKDGKSVQDKLGLSIEGAGGGYGYKATSGGERRRIDLALLLALADVSAAAVGARPGTLFADEVFDALDEVGTANAIEVLEELGRERCVIVISHSKELARRLIPTQHLHVDAGTISRLR